MDVALQLALYGGFALHEPERFERLWSLFGDSAVLARSWGRQERTTESYSSDANAADVLRTSGWLFVDGANDGFRGVTLRHLAGDHVVAVLDESPVATDLSARLTFERTIASVLGEDLFYDREHPNRALRAVPEFVAALERSKESGR